VVWLPDSSEAMLSALLPLPEIDLFDLVVFQYLHPLLQPLVEEIIDIFDWVKHLHLCPFEADALTILQSLEEKAFVVGIFRRVNAIPVVQSIPKLASV
jgi:hypothetical protein